MSHIDPREARDLREALDERARAVGDEGRRVVYRITRTGAERADALLAAIEAGRADGTGERLTAPGGGPPGTMQSYFMYGFSGYGGDDGYGPR